jgi:hypothetical protein
LGLLNNLIKLTARKEIVATLFVTWNHRVFIKLKMECNRKPVTTIVGTGSQLNIVSKVIWKTIIKRPIDIVKNPSMNDHNGGEGILRGLVQHVPLTCRQVIMEVNLYVGEHVPFQLLLR